MPGFESDRQLVERLFIPAMMSTVVSVMNRKVEEETGARLSEFDRALPLLTEAMAEPIKDLPPERCAKLIRRSKRLTEFAMKQFFELQLGLQYLIVAYWIIDLTDRGTQESPHFGLPRYRSGARFGLQKGVLIWHRGENELCGRWVWSEAEGHPTVH